MKKIRITAFFMSVALLFTFLGPVMPAGALYDLPEGKTLEAKSAILVCLGTEKKDDIVIFEREADAHVLPSALVRVMLTMVALDIIAEKNIDIDTVTGTYDQNNYNIIAGTGLGTTMNYKTNETWTIRDLLYTSFMATAAGAAVTLAVTLAGSHQAFVDRMNEKAAEIGCTNTHFTNVHALDEPNQYVSARDMYLITREAMDYSQFMTIAKTQQYQVNPISGGEARTIPTVNNMIRPSSDSYYSPMVFGRTGTTSTGRNMVSVAEDGGYSYLLVVLDEPLQDAEGKASLQYVADTKEMFRWAFNAFTYSTVLNKNEPVANLEVKLAWDTDKVSLVPVSDFSTVVASQMSANTVIKRVTKYEESVNAPVEKGTVYGKVELFINVDQKIGEVDLVAAESIEASEVLIMWENVRNFLTSPWFYGALILLTVLLIVYIVLNIAHNRKRKRRKMKRVKKYK